MRCSNIIFGYINHPNEQGRALEEKNKEEEKKKKRARERHHPNGLKPWNFMERLKKKNRENPGLVASAMSINSLPNQVLWDRASQIASLLGGDPEGPDGR